jgi:hypothetical protein
VANSPFGTLVLKKTAMSTSVRQYFQTHQVGMKDMCRCQFVGFPSGTSELETASGILPTTRAASWQHDNDAVIVCITLAYHVNLLLQHQHLLSCLLVFYLGLSVVAPFSKATSARTAGAFVVMEMWC